MYQKTVLKPQHKILNIMFYHYTQISNLQDSKTKYRKLQS